MDRALIISYLQAAEEQVANVEQQIANQRGLISGLRRNGQDTSSASAQLRVMEQTHMQYSADLDRLRAELAALNAGEAAKEDASSVTAPRDFQLGHRRGTRRTPYGRR
jgi:hypothetical protein